MITKLDFEHPVALRFHCIRCGMCCGDTEEKTRHILLLEAEAEQIAKKTLQPISRFSVKIKEKAPYNYEMRKRLQDRKCVFLKKNRCTIYSLRPLICRFYPFELKMVTERKCRFFFTEECSGLNKGSKLRKNYFEKLLKLAYEKICAKID